MGINTAHLIVEEIDFAVIKLYIIMWFLVMCYKNRVKLALSPDHWLQQPHCGSAPVSYTVNWSALIWFDFLFTLNKNNFMGTIIWCKSSSQSCQLGAPHHSAYSTQLTCFWPRMCPGNLPPLTLEEWADKVKMKNLSSSHGSLLCDIKLKPSFDETWNVLMKNNSYKNSC